MQKNNLDDLVYPISKEDFFKSYWPGNPLFIPPTKNKLENILERDVLLDLEVIVAKRSAKVRACLPDFDDEYSSLLLDAKDALKAYRNNMTLVFDQMQMQDELVAQMLEQIRLDLGLVTGGVDNDLCRARSIIYATPAGCGTRLHFDANVNFIIQMSGAKRWILAPNRSVENPTERFTTGADQMPAALEFQCHAPLIDEIPEDAVEYFMEPGCVLFVPRGYWHATTTDEDSLSLNFTFSQPTWADVFTKSMQELLLKSPQWRELADGLAGYDEKRKAAAIERFNFLVTQLGQQMPEITGAQLLQESGLDQA